jgi:hypothetical protein
VQPPSERVPSVFAAYILPLNIWECETLHEALPQSGRNENRSIQHNPCAEPQAPALRECAVSPHIFQSDKLMKRPTIYCLQRPIPERML